MYVKVIIIRIYDLKQKRFITVDESEIVSKHTIGNLRLTLDFIIGKPGSSNVGSTVTLSNFIDMIPNKGYGAGLSKLPSNYFTNDDKVEAYFSDAGLVAYNLETFRIYFYFDVKIIKEIDKIPYHIEMIGDSCELIIYYNIISP
jgi:hypothetical protein